MVALRNIRRNKGITIERLAKIAGVSRTSIRRYETGARDPKVSIMRKLAAALGVTLDELVIGDREEEKNNENFDTARPARQENP